MSEIEQTVVSTKTKSTDKRIMKLEEARQKFDSYCLKNFPKIEDEKRKKIQHMKT